VRLRVERHSSKISLGEALVGWFNGAASDLGRMQAELAEVQAECVNRSSVP
jgi:hypothetical protein